MSSKIRESTLDISKAERKVVKIRIPRPTSRSDRRSAIEKMDGLTSGPNGINSVNTPHRKEIVDMITIMGTQGFMPRLNIKARTNILSQMLLRSFGCTVVSSFDQKTNQFDSQSDQKTNQPFSKDFSLVSTQTAEVVIDNPRIITEEELRSTPTAYAPIDKFSDATDPFYQLDDPRSEDIRKMYALSKFLEMPDTIMLASITARSTVRSKNSKYMQSAAAIQRSKF